MSQNSNELIDIKEDENVKVKKYAWVVLAVVFLAGVAAPLNQGKVPPIMSVIMEDFQLDLSQAGSVNSVFAITGILLSLPAGVISEKLGYKKAGLLSLGCLALGSILGAISTTYPILLISRVIEGIGMGMLGVIAPTIIAMWFPKEKQGMPMAIWATWAPAGMLVMYIFAPILVSVSGWRSVWWFGAIYALVIMLVYGLLIKLPESSQNDGDKVKEASEDRKNLDIKKGLQNKNVWLLGLGFALFVVTGVSLTTYLPTFLFEVRGYSLSAAAQISSIGTALLIFSALLTGWLCEKFHVWKLILYSGLTIFALLAVFLFRVEGWKLFAFIVLQGLTGATFPTVCFASIGKIVEDPKWISLSLGILNMAQNFASFIGPIIFGKLVEKLGWAPASLWLVLFCAFGIIAVLPIKAKLRS